MHKTDIFNKIITYAKHILLLACVTISMAAYTSGMPKLTVFIIADGLTESNIQSLSPYWGKGGLRLLEQKGLHYTISFQHTVYGGDETTATIMTGVQPREHGYTSDTYLSRTDNRIHQILEDDKEKGIGTSLKLSPKALRTATLSDQWRIKYPKSKIYAIGIHPNTTIVMAGHGANACCWIEGNKWVSTSFYDEGLPTPADEMNINGRFQEIISREWKPRMDISMYMHPTPTETKKGFNYSESKYISRSAQANSLVTELAAQIQQYAHLGSGASHDLLLLELTTQTPNACSDYIESAEQEDMYLSLNQDLGYLMEQLDKHIGTDKYQVIICGRPLLGESEARLNETKIATHKINIDRIAALTSTYLMALYGNDKWICGGHGQSIYLNKNLIEKKKLDLEYIERQVANFVMDFEGVYTAMPWHEALQMQETANSYTKQTCGEVIIQLEPNWRLMANDTQVMDKVIDQHPTAPLIWLKPNEKEDKNITIKVDATEIKGMILNK